MPKNPPWWLNAEPDWKAVKERVQGDQYQC
jgi:hypothetical protein